MVIQRFNICLVRLDPTTRAETAKTRPCVVVSPDELNHAVATVIIAPMTTVGRGWPTRVPVRFQGKDGEIALDQIRAVDKVRLVKRLGKLEAAIAEAVLDTLGRNVCTVKKLIQRTTASFNARLRHAMRQAGLKEVRCKFDFEGTKLITS